MKTLTAKADFGMSGQYVAQITGRDAKFTFNRQFIGRKEGKRGEYTSADVDEEGLYERCDVGKRGKDSIYLIIIDCPHLEVFSNFTGTLRQFPANKEDAMKIAKAFDEGRTVSEIVKVEIEEYEHIEKNCRKKNEDGTFALGENGETLWEDVVTQKRHYVYSLIDKKEAAQKQTAQTLESAITDAWAAMQSLPAPMQKKVLAELKNRVNPKIEKEA